MILLKHLVLFLTMLHMMIISHLDQLHILVLITLLVLICLHII